MFGNQSLAGYYHLHPLDDWRFTDVEPQPTLVGPTFGSISAVTDEGSSSVAAVSEQG